MDGLEVEESQRVDAKTPKQRISRKQVEDEERTPAEDETEDDASDSEEDLELLRLEEIGIHPVSKSDLSPEEVDKKQRKRRLLAEELLQTERIYVGDLDLLWDYFREKMRENAESAHKCITPDDVKIVFGGNLQVIRGFNRMLRDQLVACLEDPEALVGGVFVKVVKFLKSYTQYCSDYENALKTLRRLRENEASAHFLQTLHENPSVSKGQINNYLILPVQRIPRYKMLLVDMLKNTWVEHPDFNDLKNAVLEIKEVALYVEAAQERFHNMNKIISIQSSLVGKKAEGLKLLSPGRVFVKEALLNMQEYSSTGSPMVKQRKLFLFNDILVITKPKKEKETKDPKSKTGSKKKTETNFSHIVRKSILLKNIHAIIPATIENNIAMTLAYEDAVPTAIFFPDEGTREEWTRSLRAKEEFVPKGQLSLRSEEGGDLRNSPSKSKHKTVREKEKKSRRLSAAIPPAPRPPDEVTVKNPLLAISSKKTRGSSLSESTKITRANTIGKGFNLSDYEGLKKSPSMDIIEDGSSSSSSSSSGLPSARRPGFNVSDEDDHEGKSRDKDVHDSTRDKRKLLQRTPSVDSIHKIDSLKDDQRPKAQAKFL
eukprot:TRINITY_DN5349_c0_g2_i2.p1 TRINITY_DN5349_c0_g2~~TRINITY_DN5349_c0_g2_i2.p1  ORF type:complete len:600 (+),score=275.46 TRINITY_DN5349_c0_g2_i2:497-2296(+)